MTSTKKKEKSKEPFSPALIGRIFHISGKKHLPKKRKH
jgi:hypothetical protein